MIQMSIEKPQTRDARRIIEDKALELLDALRAQEGFHLKELNKVRKDLKKYSRIVGQLNPRRAKRHRRKELEEERPNETMDVPVTN